MRRIRIGDWTVTPALNVMERDGGAIKLEPRAMDLLVHLAEASDRVVSADELLRDVWQGRVFDDGIVYSKINQLRKAFGDDSQSQRFIETIPKRGYRLVAAVVVIDDETSDATDAPTPRVPPPRFPVASPPPRAWALVVAMGLIAALGYFVWDRYGGLAASQNAPPAEAGSVTLAVLPFEDLSAIHDQSYFADGMAVELTSSLSRVKGLRVTDSRSSSYYKGKNQDDATIGKALGVDHLLEGSVQKERDDLRVTTQLVDPGTGHVRWSKAYSSKLTDVFAVQEEIAADVTNALQVTLGVGAIAEIPGMTQSVEAFDEYLKANALVGEPDSSLEVIDHLQRAVNLDPGFAMAWLNLETGYRLGAVPDPDVRKEWQRRAAEAYEHARNAAPDSPNVLLLGAVRKAFDGQWREAGDLYEKYLPIADMYDHDYIREGVFLMAAGKASQAVDALERAKAVNPLDATTAADLGEAYSDERNFKQSLAEFDRGLTLGRNLGALKGAASFAALGTGNKDEIRKWLNADAPMAPFLDDPTAGLAVIRRKFDEEGARENPDVQVYYLAPWAAYFSDPELALEIQRKYVASRIDDLRSAFSLWEPVFRDMRRLPGFKDLVREMGLVDYWRAYGWNDFCHAVGGGDDFECT